MSEVTTQVSVTMIGGYEVLAKLGQNSVASVYKGQHPQTGKAVAIKVMATHLTGSPKLRQRFAQECKVAYQLDHPNIVRVLDYGMDGSRAYMVMEHIDGGNLADRVEAHGPLPEAEAVRLIGQVGRALHWAHQRRLVHRNVKPENVLLTADGQAKLADLGLVKDLESAENITQSQSVLGTPHYMAPEQVQDSRKADARSDLYSLAGTLYTAVCAELPFKTASVRKVIAVYKKQLANDLVPPRDLAPQLSERTNAAILAGLRAQRDERPASVLDFLAALGEPPVAVLSANPASSPQGKKAANDDERRLSKRFPSQRATSCFALARTVGKAWRGRVVNISETGVCLELRRRFEPGAMLTFALEGPLHSRQSLVIRVMWVRKAGESSWQVGCQFDAPLCDMEVLDLLAQQ
jgi:serine/threonine protein kinase